MSAKKRKEKKKKRILGEESACNHQLLGEDKDETKKYNTNGWSRNKD